MIISRQSSLIKSALVIAEDCVLAYKCLRCRYYGRGVGGETYVQNKQKMFPLQESAI